MRILIEELGLSLDILQGYAISKQNESRFETEIKESSTATITAATAFSGTISSKSDRCGPLARELLAL